MLLALRMGRTLGELQATMSSQEFSLWLQMYDEDEWGELRGDLRTGVIAATIANYAGRERKRYASPAVPSDFMPSLVKSPVEKVDPDPVAFFTAVAKTTKFPSKG